MVAVRAQQRNRWVPLIGFLTLNAVVAAEGGWVTATSVHTWYAALRKPWFNPPNLVFGPTWTALYVLIAVAAWLVWQRGAGARKYAMPVYFAQLGLNCAWSFLFFGAHLIGPALVDILALLVAILATIAAFSRTDRRAAWLIAPYAAWVVFASLLNAAIWKLN